MAEVLRELIIDRRHAALSPPVLHVCLVKHAVLYTVDLHSTKHWQSLFMSFDKATAEFERIATFNAACVVTGKALQVGEALELGPFSKYQPIKEAKVTEKRFKDGRMERAASSRPGAYDRGT